jgi:hypothetical protein
MTKDMYGINRIGPKIQSALKGHHPSTQGIALCL